MFGFVGLGHALRVARATVRETIKNHTRSPKWPHVRELHLAHNPTCAACGSPVHAQVHHVKPFHLNPMLELDASNLITLCMDTNECHERVGHGDDFKAYNPMIRAHAASLLADPTLRAKVEQEARVARLYIDVLQMKP